MPRQSQFGAKAQGQIPRERKIYGYNGRDLQGRTRQPQARR